MAILRKDRQFLSKLPPKDYSVLEISALLSWIGVSVQNCYSYVCGSYSYNKSKFGPLSDLDIIIICPDTKILQLSNSLAKYKTSLLRGNLELDGPPVSALDVSFVNGRKIEVEIISMSSFTKVCASYTPFSSKNTHIIRYYSRINRTGPTKQRLFNSRLILSPRKLLKYDEKNIFAQRTVLHGIYKSTRYYPGAFLDKFLLATPIFSECSTIQLARSYLIMQIVSRLKIEKKIYKNEDLKLHKCFLRHNDFPSVIKNAIDTHEFCYFTPSVLLEEAPAYNY